LLRLLFLEKLPQIAAWAVIENEEEFIRRLEGAPELDDEWMGSDGQNIPLSQRVPR
jgi:hypothetical protein